MQDYPISKDLLTNFMSGFYGYGNLNSPYWFIGKEEGGGKEMEENFRRVLLWDDLGKEKTVDLIDYHKGLSFTEHQLNSIQQTWTKLVQILLEIEGKPGDKEDRRHYQRHYLGRTNGNNCELELMPLAARSTAGKWKWGEIFDDYFGVSKRKEYFDKISEIRTRGIKVLIGKYQPKLVVFYSTDKGYIDKWSQIAGGDNWNWVQLSKAMKYGWMKSESCLYVITTHPTMKGMTNDDFPKLGEFINTVIFP